MGEVKYLSDGSPVLVVGDGPERSTSLDGGRTETVVKTVEVAKLETEYVEETQIHDTPPEQNASANVGTDGAAVPARGEALNADQLDAEIAKLQAEREALAAQGQGN